MSAAKSSTPLPWLLLLLSVTTGLVDAISVLGLGKVFTANMTGNIVFLGFAAAGTPGFRVAPFVAAIAAFLLGALIAGRIGKHHAGRPLHHWLIVAALVEAALLWIAAGVSIGFDIPSQSPTASVFAIIALTGVAMGFRNATIRQLKVPDLTTTVLTLTLTGLAADSHFAGGSNPNWARRIGGVLAIFLGAMLGAVLVNRYGLTPPLILAGAMVLVGTAACALHPAAREPLAK
ncbi:YoaK family protein [Sphingomonas sp. NIBR02145]|uniref:YoaK family protein n=1 Tax=Sphingomonas sp. NIBR02145 TaxID=3014784 RepID=UPI0022B4881B|nr:YoaK family protein [Sphingomonas sp. NIBR02145]WHU04631.1 YoaK family protein [Sphingomonas sp. NIBR02145]